MPAPAEGRPLSAGVFEPFPVPGGEIRFLRFAHGPSAMTSTRPYLIRALYEWIEDNGLTPHILVDATAPGVSVPKQHVREGQIVLNINPAAVHDLRLGNDWIEFSARFGGVARAIQIPVTAVLAIYARENGQGMAFGEEPSGEEPPPPDKPDQPDQPPRPSRKPVLKIVK